MDARPIKTKRGPERTFQDELIRYLKVRDWVVRETHGNAYQNGFPDLYTAHRKYGPRWIELKILHNGLAKFENSQLEFFPQLASVGVGVWVLTACTQDEYLKLFKPANWYQYLAVSQPSRRSPQWGK